MKYINHMTSAHLDSKMQAILDKHGAEGYGVYWLIAEHIAAQIRPESTSTEWTLSWSALARHLCYTRTTLVQRLISSLAAEGLIVLTKRSENLITISMPNLLKYADEYNKKVLRKKSGQNPDNVGITPKTQALPALQTNKDLKTGACGIVDNCASDTGANRIDSALEAQSLPAPYHENLTGPELINALEKVRAENRQISNG